jgi:two-component system chemotaxis response regulator CheY
VRSLVIDDELVARSKVLIVLAGYGDADAVRTGAEALAAMRDAIRQHCPYDVITIDIDLPDTSGLRLLRELDLVERETGARPAKKIMVSANATTDAVVQAARFRCDGFLVKPFRRERLIEELTALGLSLTPAEAPNAAE